jgi:hypothetical protein
VGDGCGRCGAVKWGLMGCGRNCGGCGPKDGDICPLLPCGRKFGDLVADVAGEVMRDVGVGCDWGDMWAACICATPSAFGGKPDSDRRFCAANLLTAYRCIGWDMGAATGMRVGPRLGLPPFCLNSAWTSIPFSSNILSRREFLYLSIRHSSAALR